MHVVQLMTMIRVTVSDVDDADDADDGDDVDDVDDAESLVNFFCIEPARRHVCAINTVFTTESVNSKKPCEQNDEWPLTMTVMI